MLIFVDYRISDDLLIGETGYGVAVTGKYVPTEEPVITPNSHPAIIDEATFAKVVGQFAFMRRNTSPAKQCRLFTKILRCGHCGRPMTSIRDSRTGTVGYRCSGYLNYGNAVCRRYYIRESVLAKIVIEKLQLAFCDESLRAELFVKIEGRLEDDGRDREDERRRFEKLVATLTKKVEQAADRILTAPEDLMAALAPRLREMQEQRDAARSELIALEVAVPDPAAKQLAEEAIAELGNISVDDEPESLRRVFLAMVDRIEVWFRIEKKAVREFRPVDRGLVHLRGSFLSGLRLWHSRQTGRVCVRRQVSGPGPSG